MSAPCGPTAHLTRRRLLGGAGLLLLSAGCGGDRQPTAAAGDGAGGFPVTLTHSLGTTEIAAPPRRVVALGSQDADAAVALGVRPVGVSAYPYAESGVPPWLASELGGAPLETFDVVDGIPLERIAGLQPDVILAAQYFGIDAEYETLAGIAPVLGYRGEQLGYGFEQHTLDVGRALGREPRAREVVAGAQAAITAARDAHPEFAGRTFSYSFHFDNDAVQTINSTGDYAAQLMEQLGLALPPAVQALEGASGARISLERLGVLDADALVLAFASEDLRAAMEAHPLFRALPAVRRGDYVPASLDTITALRSPSVLSVSYGLDQLVPELAAALTD